ncbi:MAG: hypothetical protein KA765_10180 [Thermoflexales bacterium]|nr:hypothetical protein [Thermoflexales bacterium]
MVDVTEILDLCVTDIRAGRTTLAACLARYPQYAEELSAMLSVATQLPALPAASLSAEKRQAIQAQLLKQAAQRPSVPVPTRRAAPAKPVWRRWLPALAAVVVILSLAGWGVTSASAASLPGDLLYPIKRLSEQMAVALTPAMDLPNLHTAMAQRRLTEYTDLAARGELQPALLVEAVAELDTVLRQAEISGTVPPQAAVEQVSSQVEDQLQAASERVASLSIEQQQAVQLAHTRVTATRERMVELMRAHPPATPPGGPGTATATGTSTTTATATPTPTSTATATLEPTASPLPTIDPTKPAVTPPGLVNTPKPKITPPGLVNTPKPKTTPPGQEKTVKPKDPPPAKK